MKLQKKEKDHPDTESINEKDYEISSANTAIIKFKEISREGGYICAKYNNYYKIGKVLPKSRIKICSGKWRNNEKEKLIWTNNREAKLKCLKLDCVQKILPEIACLYLNDIPPMGTVRTWDKCGDLIENLVEKKNI
ncbi:MAG: hypothetical protein WA144_04180 [Candidatus Methanoperedens sp.]